MIGSHMNKTISGLRALAVSAAMMSSVERLSAENFTINIGDTISDGVPGVGAGRININTETDYFTFSGAAGQSIFVEEISVASAFAGWLRWELKSPSGSPVYSYLEEVRGRARTGKWHVHVACSGRCGPMPLTSARIPSHSRFRPIRLFRFRLAIPSRMAPDVGQAT
jgi:hypothetical protein